jgi:hypothetical protein
MDMLQLNNNYKDLEANLEQQKKSKIKLLKQKLGFLLLLVIVLIVFPVWRNDWEIIHGGNFPSYASNYDGNIVQWLVFWHGDDGLIAESKQLDNNINTQLARLDDLQKNQTTFDTLKNPLIRDRIHQCLVKNQCNGISKTLFEQLPLLRIFLSLTEDQSQKLMVDQKWILSFLETQLIGSTNTSQLINVAFANTQIIDEKLGLYKVPVIITVEFSDNQSLERFLNLTENGVFEKNNMYMEIESMYYNIASYQRNQRVDMTINAYYFIP